MYALVQFLVNKIKAIVPVKNIKDFNPESFDTDLNRAYEVFWKSPNGTNSFYAVVYLVAETEELVEQRSKRVKFPTEKRLDDLLAITLEAKQSMGYKRVQERDKEVQEKQSVGDEGTLKEISNNHKLTEKRRRSPSQSLDKNRKRVSTAAVQRRGPSPSPSESSNGSLMDLVVKSELEKMTAEFKKVLHKLKEVQEKQSVGDEDTLKEISNNHKLTEKRRRSPSQSSDKNRKRVSSAAVQRRGPSPSPGESSNGDDLVLKSELEKMTAEYKKVLHKLKLKKEKIAQLKKMNDQLQEINMSFQTQLLSMLSANSRLVQNPPPIQRLPESVNIVPDNLPKERIENNKGSRLEENPHPAQKIVQSIGIVTDNLAKERVENNEGGSLEENPHPTQKITRSIGIVTDNLAIERVENNDGGCIGENPPPTQRITRSISIVTDSLPEEGVEINDRGNSDPLEDKLYLHDNGSLMKWKDEQMELAPGVSIKKDQWEKIVSIKNINPSRFVRGVAMTLWDVETLKDRSVTGAACKRFKNAKAKKALEPIKVDAVQNALRFWLTKSQVKKKEEVLKLSTTVEVRKLLSNKIMDLTKHQRSKATLER